MSFSGTPVQASIDYSLLQDILSSSQFDQTYFGEPYHISQSYPPDPFLDTNAFSPTIPSIERPNINPASLTHDTSVSSFSPAPLDRSGPSHASPASSASFRPSPTHSPSLSPRTLKRESPSSPTSDFFSPPCKRAHQQQKKLHITHKSKSPTTTSAHQRPRRQPHNQVERKYREGLNAALERLRHAVPATLPAYTEDGVVINHTKISKATILVRAIEHIKAVEAERDALREENERLRARKGVVWTAGEDMLEGFMLDY